MNKTCVHCNITKPESEFYKNKYSKDGLHCYCKECRSEIDRISYAKNSDKKRESTRRWRLRNPGYSNKYDKNRMKYDIQFKLSKSLRSRMKAALNNDFKSGSTVNDLGCSMDYFKKHIESLWTINMSWDNYGKGNGKWCIDHIFPISRANLSNREEFLKVCHYTNMQPMWWIENNSKQDKLEYSKEEK